MSREDPSKYRNTRRLGYTSFGMLIVITVVALWQGWLKDHVETFVWMWSALVITYIVVPNARSGAENIWGNRGKITKPD